MLLYCKKCDRYISRDMRRNRSRMTKKGYPTFCDNAQKIVFLKPRGGEVVDAGISERNRYLKVP
jgi:hypothetical protein